MSNEIEDNYEYKSRVANERRRQTQAYSGLGKLPPQATDLEECVLGAIMLDKEAMFQVNDFLMADHFYKDNHQKIFKAIQTLSVNNDPIDIKTVTQTLRKSGELELIGGAYYITELTSHVTSGANIGYHARIVYEKYLSREAIRVGTEMVQSGYEDTSDVHELLESTQLNLMKLTNFTTSQQSSHIGEMITAGLIELEKPATNGLTGVGTGFIHVNNFTAGWQKGELTILAARPAMGKAQPLDAGVLTPIGFCKIGELTVGDTICNSECGTQKVTGVFPQGIKQTYLVKFNDGTETRCCDEHLWLTYSRHERKFKQEPTVKNLKEIRESLITGSDNRKNHSVDFVSPVFFSRQELLIHPYVMGVLLGDACLKNMNIANPELDVIRRMEALLPDGTIIKRRRGGSCPTFGFLNKKFTGKKCSLELLVEKYGLGGKNSPDKIIPPEYLRNSFENRLELLRGLLDTDGYVVDRHCIEFSTTSPWIKIGIIDLVRSLGGRATFKEKQGQYKKNGENIICKKYYRINISFTTFDFIPVTSKKHQARYQYSKNKLQKFITEVIPDKMEECVCISVSGHDKLYITDGYILTHNTALAMQFARNGAVLYQVPTAVFSLEMTKAQLTRRMIANETEIFLERINKKTLTDYDKQILAGKLHLLRNSPLHVDDTPALTTVAFRTKCIRLKKLYDIQFIVVDYLQLMRGVTAEGKNKGNREQEIGEITRCLKAVAKDLDVPVIALSQLSRAVESRPGVAKRPMLQDLRESGNIEQDADNVLFLFRPEYYGLSEIDGMPTQSLAELIWAKHRMGEIGSLYLKFRGAVMRFENWTNPNAEQIQAQFTPINEKPEVTPDDEIPF